MSEEKAKNVLNDIGLCIQATKALQNKLEKLSASLEEFFTESGAIGAPRRATTTQFRPTRPTDTRTAVTATRPAAAKPSQRATRAVQPSTSTTRPRPTAAVGGVGVSRKKASTGTSQHIDGYAAYIRKTTKGIDASEQLARLRDAIIEDTSTGSHPAFYEMAKWVTQLKRLGEIDEDTREDLLDQLEDWKRRLTRDV